MVWGGIGCTLMKQSIKIRSKTKKVNWIMAGTIIIISIVYTSITWNGFKPAIELSNNGIVIIAIAFMFML